VKVVTLFIDEVKADAEIWQISGRSCLCFVYIHSI